MLLNSKLQFTASQSYQPLTGRTRLTFFPSQHIQLHNPMQICQVQSRESLETVFKHYTYFTLGMNKPPPWSIDLPRADRRDSTTRGSGEVFTCERVSFFSSRVGNVGIKCLSLARGCSLNLFDPLRHCTSQNAPKHSRHILCSPLSSTCRRMRPGDSLARHARL